jgi:hypothetical protein
MFVIQLRMSYLWLPVAYARRGEGKGRVMDEMETVSADVGREWRSSDTIVATDPLGNIKHLFP